MTLRTHKSRRYWQTLITEWEASNETQKAFCERKAIRYAGFLRWRQRLKASNAPIKPDSDVFLPLQVCEVTQQIATTNPVFSLGLNQNYRLEIPCTASRADLTKLFTVLGILT